MTGYTESLTDPSYTGQILIFSYPLIGNYGVEPMQFWESKKIHVRGVIVAQYNESTSPTMRRPIRSRSGYSASVSLLSR